MLVVEDEVTDKGRSSYARECENVGKVPDVLVKRRGRDGRLGRV